MATWRANYLSFVRWSRSHPPEVLLVPASACALVVTALSDITERAPFGHELGIGASSVAFAYIGGYIFNWLVVVRPRNQSRKAYYKALRLPLGTIAMDGANLLSDLEHVKSVCAKIEMRELLTPPQYNARKLLRERITWHRHEYARVQPLLQSFKPDVSVAITEVVASTLLLVMENLPYEYNGVQMSHSDGKPPTQMTLEGYANVVYDYYVDCENLRATLNASRLKNGPVKGGMLLLETHKANWEQMHGRNAH
jgi:hypothetical protein